MVPGHHAMIAFERNSFGRTSPEWKHAGLQAMTHQR
jgi:hypothetical protein